jgi:hypothetical protein
MPKSASDALGDCLIKLAKSLDGPFWEPLERLKAEPA